MTITEEHYFISKPGQVVTNPCPAGVSRFHTFSDRAVRILNMPHQ